MENKQKLSSDEEDIIEAIKDLLKGLFHWVFAGITMLIIIGYFIFRFVEKTEERILNVNSDVTTICVAYIAFRLMPYKLLDVFTSILKK